MPLKISFEENEINIYLRVDEGIDAKLINGMVDAAKVEAEEYLNTNFADENGEAQEAPASVKDWVLNRVAEKYENRGKQPKPDFAAIQPHRIYPFRG